MAITGYDLGRRDRSQTHRVSHMGFHCRVDIGIRPHGPGEFADRHRLARGTQAASIAIDLKGP